LVHQLETISSQYLALLNNSKHSLFFQHPNYLRLLSKHLGAIPYIVGIEKENSESLSIALPILLKEGSKGLVVNSLPYFGSNGSFVCEEQNPKKKEELMKELINILFDWCSEKQVVSLNVVTNYFNQDEKHWFELNYKPDYISERFGQVTSIPLFSSEDYDSLLLKQFQDPRPRNIRKAINSGVNIRRAKSQDDWDFLYKVHKENMQGIGAPVKSKGFFSLISKEISTDNYSLHIAEIENKTVACMLVFHAFETVEYYTPGTLSEFRNQQPSALLVFEVMKDMSSKGYKWWNWGGSSSRESGVYDFKKKWCAIEMPYYHMTKIFNETIYKSTSEELLEQYPGFYVVPFNQLKNE